MTQNPSLLPTAVKPIHYDLTILPNITNLTFEGLVHINLLVKKDTDSIVFNCKALDIKVTQITKDEDNSEIEITEKIVNSEKQTCTLKLTNYLKKDEKWTLYIEFYGIINRGMAGFYCSSYNDLEGNEKMVVSTHFESSDARQAFPCWDEPALRATFDIKLIVEKDLIALANTPVESKNEIEINGERFDEYTFERTPNMSTYIVAFAIGDFDYVEGRTVEQDIVTRVYATRGSAHLGKFALNVAVRSMDLYYKLFNQPYPIKKLDLIAIPDFNIAAMENWGLITFRTVRLLNEDGISSLESTQSVADNVAHEVAHQWFGNLVALEWWSQLWLKEGFATYIASYAVDKLFPEWDVWTKFILDNLHNALNLDALKASHPIQVPVNDPEEIGQIFDDISYSKGASILRMLFSYLGEDNFFEGIRIYLNKYQYSNATTSELWQCLEQASNKPVSEFMDLWTNVAGYPLLSVKYHNNNQLLIEQSRFYSNNDTKDKDTTTLWWIPLLLNQSNSIEVLNEKQMILDIQLNQFIKFNNNSIGVYRVCYDEQCLLDLGKQIEFGSSLTDSDKIGLLSDVYHTAISGHLSITFYLNFVFKFKNEKNPLVLREISKNLNNISSLFYNAPEHIQNGLNNLKIAFFKPILNEYGFHTTPNDKESTGTLRATIIEILCNSNHKETIDKMLELYENWLHNEDMSIANDIRPLFLRVAAKFGTIDQYAQVKIISMLAPTAQQQLTASMALCFTQDQELIEETLRYTISTEVRAQDTCFLISILALNPKARDLTWQFVKDNWELLEGRYKHNVSTLGEILRSSASLLASKKDLKDLKDFFEVKNHSSFNMALDNTIEKVEMNVNFVEKASNQLESWLIKQEYTVQP